MGGILNVVLDPLLMFVVFPKGQEVFGASLASLFSNIIACIYLLIVFLQLSKKDAPLTPSITAAKNTGKRI